MTYDLLCRDSLVWSGLFVKRSHQYCNHQYPRRSASGRVRSWESDAQLADRMFANLRQTWWHFLTPRERTARARRLDEALRRGLAAAPTATRKAAWFRALYETATSAATVQWLREVWAERVTIPGLPLAETDYMRLALELPVREPAGRRDILDTQAARITNADRRAQF